MPRPLLDSVKNGRSFAASASRDRFAHCPSGRLRRGPSASRYFGLAFGEVSLASLGAFPLALGELIFSIIVSCYR